MVYLIIIIIYFIVKPPFHKSQSEKDDECSKRYSDHKRFKENQIRENTTERSKSSIDSATPGKRNSKYHQCTSYQTHFLS